MLFLSYLEVQVTLITGELVTIVATKNNSTDIEHDSNVPPLIHSPSPPPLPSPPVIPIFLTPPPPPVPLPSQQSEPQPRHSVYVKAERENHEEMKNKAAKWDSTMAFTKRKRCFFNNNAARHLTCITMSFAPMT